MYAMLSNFKFVLYCFSKIVHYNYGFMLNTSYYFYPTQFILPPLSPPPPPPPLPYYERKFKSNHIFSKEEMETIVNILFEL